MERPVGREGDFGRHRGEEVAVAVVGKLKEEMDEMAKAISERYENVVDEVGERENEGRPGCQKTAVEEVANLAEM